MSYPVIEPYRAYIYIHHLKWLNEKLTTIIESKSISIDFRLVFEYVSEVLDQLYLPTFVVKFDDWIATQEKSTNDRYKKFFKNKNNNWNYDIECGYNYIDVLARTVCRETINNIESCISAIVRDNGLLRNVFGLDIKSNSLKIQITEGDRHNKGRQPILISDEKKK